MALVLGTQFDQGTLLVRGVRWKGEQAIGAPLQRQQAADGLSCQIRCMLDAAGRIALRFRFVDHKGANMKIQNLMMWVALLLLGAIAPVMAERTAGENIDDATLSTRTKAALIDSDQVTARHINVEVHTGIILLGGFVESQAEHAAAMAAARKVAPGADVRDAMIVLTGSRSLGESVDDAAIQSKLKAKIVSIEGLAAAHRINTEVKQGKVLLSGFVGHDSQKAQAESIAKAIEGVHTVYNRLVVVH